MYDTIYWWNIFLIGEYHEIYLYREIECIWKKFNLWNLKVADALSFLYSPVTPVGEKFAHLTCWCVGLMYRKSSKIKSTSAHGELSAITSPLHLRQSRQSRHSFIWEHENRTPQCTSYYHGGIWAFLSLEKFSFTHKLIWQFRFFITGKNKFFAHLIDYPPNPNN